MQDQWLSYGELAWTEPILAPPEDCVEETEIFVNLIKRHLPEGRGELLHLACGAGCNDFTFKRHFAVTGLDISEQMLQIARKVNPEVLYLHGDMRDFNLGRHFDVVVIPDSIDYVRTVPEIANTITAACRHLKPGGVLLVVAKVREGFQDNNFCYTGTAEGVQITVFENNHVHEPERSSYEANLVYLIRREGRLKIYTDRHVLGLFSQREWLSVLQDAGLSVRQEELQGMYDRFILGEGHYPMQAYIGIKRA